MPGLWRAVRSIRPAYALVTEYDDGPPDGEVARFPAKTWFAATALLFTPDGTRLRLGDGTTATVHSPEAAGAADEHPGRRRAMPREEAP